MIHPFINLCFGCDSVHLARAKKVRKYGISMSDARESIITVRVPHRIHSEPQIGVRQTKGVRLGQSCARRSPPIPTRGTCILGTATRASPWSAGESGSSMTGICICIKHHHSQKQRASQRLDGEWRGACAAWTAHLSSTGITVRTVMRS